MTRRGPNAKNDRSSPGDGADVPFEESLAELERIIDRIETGKVGLEESIAEYERGAALLRRCRAILDRAEQRITELTTPPSDAGGAGERR